MVITAAVLAVGINVGVDLGALFKRRHQKNNTPAPVCGIKVAGYHIAGVPGQKFEYAGETYTIPRERYVEVISLPGVKDYTFNGEKLPLDGGDGTLDAFSFRAITLPLTAIQGANRHE